MSRRVAKRSNVFLMELILTILFFSLAAAICMQFFAGAKSLSDKTYATNKAVMIAKNVENVFTSSEDPQNELLAAYQPASLLLDGQSGIIVHYDDSFIPTSAAKGVYTMEIQWSSQSDNPNMIKGSIRFTGKDLEYELPISKCIPSKVL